MANADTAIFIVSHDSPLCSEVLRTLRTPGTLSAAALATFETSWFLYETLYAKAGGPIGVLIHSELRKRGPVLSMGQPNEVARVTRFLTLKARSITRNDLTPLFVDPAFEATVRSVVAALSHTDGRA